MDGFGKRDDPVDGVGDVEIDGGGCGGIAGGGVATTGLDKLE